MKGNKQAINIQCQLRVPLSPEAKLNIPKRFWHKNDGYTKKFLPFITVMNPKENLCNWDKMAQVIREEYGYGTFNVLFLDYFNLNKKRHPCIECCRRWGIRCANPRKKHIWYRCRKFTQPKMKKRARIEILPAEGGDYNYRVLEDKMRLFSSWFWKE